MTNLMITARYFHKHTQVFVGNVRSFHPVLPKIWMSPFGCTMVLWSTQPLTDLSTRNVSRGSKGDRYVGLTTLPPSCADCLEIWEPQTNATLRISNRPVQGLLYLYLTRYFNPKHEKDERKSVLWESRCSVRTDRHDRANTHFFVTTLVRLFKNCRLRVVMS